MLPIDRFQFSHHDMKYLLAKGAPKVEIGVIERIVSIVASFFTESSAIASEPSGFVSQMVYSVARKKQLQEWIDQAPTDIAKIHRKIAIERINRAKREKQEMLNLSYLDLTSLPEELLGSIGPQLKTLYLTGNKLTTLPEKLLRFCPQLKSLDLDDNELTILPEKLLRPCSQLKSLDLHNNQLTTISEELLPHLHQLTSLRLSNNQLKTLPLSISNIATLEYLMFDNNLDLREIPISYRKLTELRLYFFSIVGTRITPEDKNRFIENLRIECTTIDRSPLPRQLQAFLSYGKKAPELSKEILNHFPTRDHALISEWLKRLEQTQDFRHSQMALAKIITDILLYAAKDAAFRATFIEHVRANNECCEDRAAQALNEIYIEYTLNNLEESSSMKEKLQRCKGAAKTIALRQAIARQIDAYEKRTKSKLIEGVEIYLYYESHLAKELKLVTAVSHPEYATDYGKSDWIDISALKKEVDREYLHVMSRFTSLENLVKNHDLAYARESSEIDRLCDKALEHLEEGKPFNTLLTEVHWSKDPVAMTLWQEIAEKCKAANTLKEQTTLYIEALNLVRDKREALRAHFLKKWLEKNGI